MNTMRTLFFVIALLPLGILQAEEPRRPNILFIYTDDQAPTAVGALGNDEIKTPHIDRIFREGATLVNAFTTTPVCSPSRASLMTSRYGSEVKITEWLNPRSDKHGLPARLLTWPELLQKAGYKTGLVGKWHLGLAAEHHPTKHGYDEFSGFLAGGTSPKDPVIEHAGETKKRAGFTADVLTDYALDFIDRHANREFALSLHYRAPHAAWLPVREEDWAPYESLQATLPDPDVPDLNVAKIRKQTREYYASVSSVDRNVGRLLDLLEAKKIADNTVVIFTSDHGYHVGHHGLWFKGNAQHQRTKLPPQEWPHIPPKQRPNLLDQALRVPTAIRWPKVVKPNTKIDQTVSNLDWFPTLLAIAGVNAPADTTIRGDDFSPILRGETIEWNNDLYAEYSMKYGAQTHMRGWRTPNWKLMIDFNNEGRGEMYDLANDPREKKNLFKSKDETAVKIRKELTARIRQQMQKIGDPVIE